MLQYHSQLILFIDTTIVFWLWVCQWVALDTPEENWIYEPFFQNGVRWESNLKNLKKDAAHGPHVLRLIILLLHQNDFWGPVPSGTNVGRETAILTIGVLGDVLNLFNECFLGNLFVKILFWNTIFSNIIPYSKSIATLSAGQTFWKTSRDAEIADFDP